MKRESAFKTWTQDTHRPVQWVHLAPGIIYDWVFMATMRPPGTECKGLSKMVLVPTNTRVNKLSVGEANETLNSQMWLFDHVYNVVHKYFPASL